MKRAIAIAMLGAFTACQKSAPPPPPPAPVETPASPVAKVNVALIKVPLQNRIFARPENKELKTQFDTLEAKQHARGEEMMKKYAEAKKKGKMDMDFAKQPRDPNMDADRLLNETVDNLVKKELADVIQTMFPDKYSVVIEQSYRDGVIYAKNPVPDITNDVRDYLVRESLPKTPGQP